MSGPVRRPLVAGNWKMHTTVPEALTLTKSIMQGLDAKLAAEVVLLPPFISVWPVGELLVDDPRIAVGAQDCYWEKAGAYTGAVSAQMLRHACQYVLVGHSERRQLFGDSQEVVRRKLEAVLAADLKPILAVGETATERSSGRTQSVLTQQVRSALTGITETDLRRCALAYEPVWAIGAGKTAEQTEISSSIRVIREELSAINQGAGEEMRVLYGGSVTGESAAGILRLQEVDGALVGGASLDAQEFCAIVAAAAPD